MDSEEMFNNCVNALWKIFEKYRRLNVGNKQANDLLAHMERDFWIAQIAILKPVNPKRAMEIAKRLNIDTENDRRLSEFL